MSSRIQSSSDGDLEAAAFALNIFFARPGIAED